MTGRPRAASNGNGNKMDSRSHKELEKIERQIGQLELVPGQDDDTRREIQELHARIDALRDQVIRNNPAPGRRPNWPGIRSAHTPLDYIERIFTDWSEIHGDRSFADDHAMVVRHGAVSRRRSPGHRHAKGPGHEAKSPPQFWAAQSGRLPQSPAGDEDCGKIPPSDYQL